jgi:hypothetical protein
MQFFVGELATYCFDLMKEFGVLIMSLRSYPLLGS